MNEPLDSRYIYFMKTKIINRNKLFNIILDIIRI